MNLNLHFDILVYQLNIQWIAMRHEWKYVLLAISGNEIRVKSTNVAEFLAL